jgi:hypothetical protein
MPTAEISKKFNKKLTSCLNIGTNFFVYVLCFTLVLRIYRERSELIINLWDKPIIRHPRQLTLPIVFEGPPYPSTTRDCWTTSLQGQCNFSLTFSVTVLGQQYDTSSQ